MTGGVTFNEVFLTEVRVLDDYRLGEVNCGWSVAQTTLMNERAAIGTQDAHGGGGDGLVERAIELARTLGMAGEPLVRQRLADLIIRSRVAQFRNQRMIEKSRSGQTPGPELSLAKLADNQLSTCLADFVSSVLGARLAADCGEWGTYSWGQLVLGAPGMHIGGGTDEVMRNIIAERVLGLPREPGIDTKTPFRKRQVATEPT